MFSMSAGLPLPILPSIDPAIFAQFARFGVHGVSQGTGALHSASEASAADVLSVGWPELERILPDRGLPRGVTEIAAPISKQGMMRGGATTIALRAIREAQRRDPRAWCAWVTGRDGPSLYAPAVAQEGVDLERLLVVRPNPTALARAAVKASASGAFAIVVVDVLFSHGRFRMGSSGDRVGSCGAVVVRKLALSAEEKGTSTILLTNVYAERSVPWPVALRMEVERRPEAVSVRITKDRRGRAVSQHVVRLAS